MAIFGSWHVVSQGVRRIKRTKAAIGLTCASTAKAPRYLRHSGPRISGAGTIANHCCSKKLIVGSITPCSSDESDPKRAERSFRNGMRSELARARFGVGVEDDAVKGSDEPEDTEVWASSIGKNS